MISTLVATPDPAPCTCRFASVRIGRGLELVFRRDPACPAHAHIVIR